MTTRSAAFTVVSRNYLPFARLLADSYLKHHPEQEFFCVVIDDPHRQLTDDSEPFNLLRVEDLGIDDLRHRAFYYSITEYATSVKPDALLHLLGHFQSVIYLDPDIDIYAPLTPIFDALRVGNIVLTPHALAPIGDGFFPSELDFLKTGVYNLGFIAVSRSDDATQMLEWWRARLISRAFIDSRSGTFTDQKWIDLVPAYWQNTVLLRDKGCNVAYWNLHERMVTHEPQGWMVDGLPLRFFHFSGINQADPQSLSRHQDRFNLENSPHLAPLILDYVSRLQLATNAEDKAYSYEYARFADGTGIDGFVRRTYYHYLHQEEIDRGRDPFTDLGPGSFYAWLAKRHLLNTGRPSVRHQGSKGIAKPERFIFDEHPREFALAARGFRAMHRVLGRRRYLQLIEFLEYIGSSYRHPYVYLPPVREKGTSRKRGG